MFVKKRSLIKRNKKRSLIQQNKESKPFYFEIDLSMQPGAETMIQLMRDLENESRIKIAEHYMVSKDKVRIKLINECTERKTTRNFSALTKKRVNNKNKACRQLSAVISK